MISDEKAIRYARLLKQYCNERPCRDGECAFLQEISGIRPLTEGRLPEDWNLDGLAAKDKRKTE